MVRKLHSLAGLIAALFLTVLSLSGVALSLDPALERLQATVPADGQISVAALAGRVAQHYPDVEQIERTPSGSIIVYYTRNDQPGADRIDPVSGQGIAPHAPSGFSRWSTGMASRRAGSPEKMAKTSSRPAHLPVAGGTMCPASPETKFSVPDLAST